MTSRHLFQLQRVSLSQEKELPIVPLLVLVSRLSLSPSTMQSLRWDAGAGML
jgi:hypothetical protein